MEHIIKLRFEKSTKNTHKYEEVPSEGKPPVLGQLYIQKWALPSAAPSNLVVKITEPQVTI